jgi:diaminopimelate epimerase
MKFLFAKYSGAGNDFIILDGSMANVILNKEAIAKLCDRHNGVGADGVIVQENSDSCDFKMRIYNADGSEAEMCGNGIRCLALHIKRGGFNNSCCTIESMRRKHLVSWDGDSVRVEMGPPKDIQWNIPIPLPKGCLEAAYMDMGVPHTVLFHEDDAPVDFMKFAPAIRHHPFFGPRGTNVNLARVYGNEVTIRTYERGVEAETQACGTGATAAAIAAAHKYRLASPVPVFFGSGISLKIHFNQSGDAYTSASMEGPCTHIFDGVIPKWGGA